MRTPSLDFQNHIAQTTPYPIGIIVEKANGSTIYAKDGKPYLDFISGIGVANLGHGNKAINNAIKAQVDKHLHVMVYGEFEQEAQTTFAKNLCATLPENLNAVYFVNSGTEANEAAMKLVKRATGRSKIIAFKGAYHGNTQGSLSLSYNPVKKNAFRPLLPDIHFIELNNFEDLELIDSQTAGVFLETIQGDAGVRIPTQKYLEALRTKCTQVGALLAFDEIQCGFGRTGKNWAFEHFNVVPDILTAGKALGGGLPIGALIASQDLLKLFTLNPMLGHITTFGGHPLPCAAGNAALQILNSIDYEEVNAKASYLTTELNKSKSVVSVRQIGMMLAIDLQDATAVEKVFKNCLENGVIIFWFLSCPSSFRLAPPLTISWDDLKKGTQTILQALDSL